MKTLWKPNSSTNTLFCTGTSFYKSKHPPLFQPEKPSARTCKNWRYYIQLLQNAMSCLQTAYSNPTLPLTPLTPLAPPHRIVTDHIASTGGRWQDRHGNLLYPAIWSPTGWRMGFPNAKMFKVFWSEGQVCFNSRWLKIYGTSKIPRNILGTLTFHHPFGRLPRACHWLPFSHELRQAL